MKLKNSLGLNERKKERNEGGRKKRNNSKKIKVNKLKSSRCQRVSVWVSVCGNEGGGGEEEEEESTFNNFMEVLRLQNGFIWSARANKLHM